MTRLGAQSYSLVFAKAIVELAESRVEPLHIQFDGHDDFQVPSAMKKSHQSGWIIGTWENGLEDWWWCSIGRPPAMVDPWTGRVFGAGWRDVPPIQDTTDRLIDGLRLTDRRRTTKVPSHLSTTIRGLLPGVDHGKDGYRIERTGYCHRLERIKSHTKQQKSWR